HERRAAEMAEVQRRTTGDDTWRQLAPDLDDALASLGQASRDAVVLRFFEGQSGPEVAQRLGISEEAARKRISRAIDELRGIFAQKGITVSTAALGDILALNLTQRAPVGLAAAAASAGAVKGAGTGLTLA